MLPGIGEVSHAESPGATLAIESESGEPADTSPVVIISPDVESKPFSSHNRMLAEDEAYDLVWNLPEIQKEIEKILERGGVPVANVAARPAQDREPEAGASFYVVRFHGIQENKAFSEMLLYVDAVTGKILMYDSFKSLLVPLDEWRKARAPLIRPFHRAGEPG